MQALSKLTHYADAKVSVQYIPTVTRLVVSGALVAPMQTAATQVAALLLVLRSVPRALVASLVVVCAAEPPGLQPWQPRWACRSVAMPHPSFQTAVLASAPSWGGHEPASKHSIERMAIANVDTRTDPGPANAARSCQHSVVSLSVIRPQTLGRLAVVYGTTLDPPTIPSNIQSVSGQEGGAAPAA